MNSTTDTPHSNYLTRAKQSLDPNVWNIPDDGTPPILQYGIKTQIVHAIEDIRNIVSVNELYIAGPITSNMGGDTDPINVYVEVEDEEIDSLVASRLSYLLQKMNHKLAVSTSHTIIYMICPGEFEYNDHEAVYNVRSERWIKSPKVHSDRVAKQLTALISTINSVDFNTGKILRNTVSFGQIKRMNFNDKTALYDGVKRKMVSLVSDIQYYAKVFKSTRYGWFITNHKTPSLELLRDYYIRNKPPEQLMYSLYQLHYCRVFLRKLDALLSGDGAMPADIINRAPRSYKQVFVV